MKKVFEKYDKMLLMGRVHEKDSLRELSGAARQCVSLMEDRPGEADATVCVREEFVYRIVWHGKVVSDGVVPRYRSYREVAFYAKTGWYRGLSVRPLVGWMGIFLSDRKVFQTSLLDRNFCEAVGFYMVSVHRKVYCENKQEVSDEGLPEDYGSADDD